MDEVSKIINEIKAGNIKPIYFLMGEEAFFIDKLSDYIENNILTEDEKSFNQMVIYGRDTTIEDIVSNAKRYPMMADRQVIIVKEAQNLIKTIEQLDSYAENPQPTTVLVIAYKYKTLDKRRKLAKTIAKNGVLLESKKVYENQVGTWINKVLAEKGYSIEPKANAMLVEFLGNDLGRIYNELEKLEIILTPSHKITPADIERNIGFSKDFNNFELRKAIGDRDQKKAYTIVNHFAQNPKDNPIVLTITLLFSFFSQLLQYHGLKNKDPKNVASVLGVNPFFLKDYDIALKNFPMRKVSAIVASLRDIDVKSKGVGANALSHKDLLNELLVHIFN